ncbi:MAG TPA: alpha/beta family hydrolase [Acidimicrobiia bacterium]
MIERVEIAWDGGVTSGRWHPGDGLIGVVLAHGAGAGQDHAFMVAVRDGLAAARVAVLTFNYDYAEAGRRAPDRLPKLLAVHRAAASWCSARADSVVLAGKSMGGRVGSHLVGDDGWPAAGLVYLGYPLVPPGKGPRPTDHLNRIAVPQLFVAGSRDRLSPPDLIEPLAAALPSARAVIVEGADHSFRVPKTHPGPDPLAWAIAATVEWLHEL